MNTFISQILVNVRNNPSLRGQVLGQVAANQEIQTTGKSVIADGWVWQEVADSGGGLWIAERTVDSSRVLLRPKTPPTPAMSGNTIPLGRRTTGGATALTDFGEPTIPANVDLDPKDYLRTFRAALAITRAFEGGGFSSYNNYDRGIVSYGIMQFTLSSGSLVKVLELYLNGNESMTAIALRGEYLSRIRAKDPALRNDIRFRDLLRAAATEVPMQRAQFQVTVSDYWDVVLVNYVQRRGNVRLPLTYALLFDMGINFGVNHAFFRLAEESFNIPANSRIGTGGITEQQLTTKIAELRRESHYRQAARDNLPGLRVRGDFWVNLCLRGDWGLQGDADGFLSPKAGVRVQVRRPS